MLAEAPSAPASARPHLCWLDWLRFLAAFAVLVDHTRYFQWHRYNDYLGYAHPLARLTFISLFSLGKQAVVLFFVLSGWLVGGHTIQKLRAGTFDAVAYAADRLARVYVPLAPALLLSLAISRGLDEDVQPAQYLVCLFGLQGVFSIQKPIINGPLWTLGLEIWFYVLAGCAAVAWQRGGSKVRQLVGLAGAALAIGICCKLDGTYLLCWLMGAAGFWVRERIVPSSRSATALIGALLMTVGAVIFQVQVDILPSAPLPGFLVLPSASAAQLIVASGSLLLIASLVSMAPRSPAGRRFERMGGTFAAFSYTLYLTHFPVLYALRLCLQPMRPELTLYSVSRACSWAAACVAVALVMYALFERQTPRVRRWLRERLGGTNRQDLAPIAPALAART